jgi:predicted transcriptional regulator
MGVISIRLNKDEEKVLKKLAEHFHEDKSALVRKSLLELYENVVDLDEIKRFEAKERKGKASFFTAEDVLNK